MIGKKTFNKITSGLSGMAASLRTYVEEQKVEIAVDREKIDQIQKVIVGRTEEINKSERTAAKIEDLVG